MKQIWPLFLGAFLSSTLAFAAMTDKDLTKKMQGALGAHTPSEVTDTCDCNLSRAPLQTNENQFSQLLANPPAGKPAPQQQQSPAQGTDNG